jgi:RNA polymerase II-associated factor 1
MLLPPLNTEELAAFQLTSLEKEMKRDVLFPPDLGIPINALDIERYSIPLSSSRSGGSSLTKGELHPADAALLQVESKGGPLRGVGGLTGRDAHHHRALREGASDVTWLMRTKYISNDFGTKRTAASIKAAKEDQIAVGGSQGADAAAVDLDDPQVQIASIEASFEAARRPAQHPKNPSATVLEELPILPDELLDGWNLVQTIFDGNPGGDVDALIKLTPEERARSVQASQLKSFVRKKADGGQDRFVAWLLPKNPPPAASTDDNAHGALAITAPRLCGDYEWVREYDSQVKFDEKNQTYLFRLGKEYVGYSDLNTKVALMKRKRGAAGRKSGGGQRDDEEDAFLQPEKFILELEEGGHAGEKEEEERHHEEAGGEEEHEQGAQAMEVDNVEAAAAAGGAASGGHKIDIMKNVFGSDDEDE